MSNSVAHIPPSPRNSSKATEQSQSLILLAFVVIAVSVRAAFALTGSALFGRLSIPPPYDDVTYFVDALRRLRVFYDQGTWALLSDLGLTGTHSPLSFVLAFTGFGLFGAKEIGPYIMNAAALSILIFSLLKIIKARLNEALVAVIAVVFLPYTDWVITFFHPDAIAGLVVAVGCAALVCKDILSCKFASLMVIGCLLGAGLISKPTATPVAVAILGVAILLSLVYSLRVDRNRRIWRTLQNREMLLKVAVLGIGILVPSLPYFFVNAHWIGSYVRMALIDHQSVAGVDGSFWVHSTYYFISARHVFGLGIWIFPVVVISSIFIYTKTRCNMAMSVIFLFGLSLVAYAITSIPKVKLAIFGSYFYGIVFVTLVVGVVFISRLISKYISPTISNITGILLATSIVINGRDIQSRFTPDYISTSRLVYDELIPLFTRELAAPRSVSPRPPRVLFMYPWPVTPHAFMYALMRDGSVADVQSSFAWDVSGTAYYSANAQDHIGKISDSKIIITLDESTVSSSGLKYPVNAALSGVNRAIREDPDLKLLKSLSTVYGAVFVFVRSERASLAPGAGVGEWEGPYPAWKLPNRVRWLSAAGATLKLTSPASVGGKIVGRCSPGPAVSSVRYSVGNSTFTVVKISPGFQVLEIPVTFNETQDREANVLLQPLGEDGSPATDGGQHGLLCEGFVFKPT